MDSFNLFASQFWTEIRGTRLFFAQKNLPQEYRHTRAGCACRRRIEYYIILILEGNMVLGFVFGLFDPKTWRPYMWWFLAGNNGSKVDEWPLMTGDFGKHVFYFNLLIKNRATINYLIQKRTNPISLYVSLLRSKKATEQGNLRQRILHTEAWAASDMVREERVWRMVGVLYLASKVNHI